MPRLITPTDKEFSLTVESRYPEREVGRRMAHSLVVPNMLDYIGLSPDYSIIEIPAPAAFVGRSLRETDLRAKYGALNNVVGSELCSYLPNAVRLVFEGERGGLRSRLEPLDDREVADNLIGQPIHEQVAVRLGAKVLQRKDGNNRRCRFGLSQINDCKQSGKN